MENFNRFFGGEKIPCFPLETLVELNHKQRVGV